MEQVHIFLGICFDTDMKIYLIQGYNRVQCLEAEVDGDEARIPLPWGASKVVRKPRWQETEREARVEVANMRQRRLQSLKRQIRKIQHEPN